MASNLPGNRPEALSWLENRLVQWNDNLAGIGLTSAQTIDLALDLASARTSFTSVQNARADAKSKTQTWYGKANTMHTTGSDLITSIKAFASNSDDPNAVYELAGMTGKAPPSPIPAPGTPTIDGAVLIADGSVMINFSGTGAAGTVWQVNRKLASETEYSFVGTGDPTTKSFVDNTIPIGTVSATYTITGQRGGQTGLPSLPAIVQFGSVEGVVAAAAA